VSAPERGTGLLDLAHGRAPPNSAAKVDASATAQDREYQRGDEGSPAEPQEGGRGLRLTAALGGIGGSVCDVVGECVALEANY
jgi:hypothetical protein